MIEENGAHASSIFDSVERRDFLKGLGTSFAALSLPACDFRPPEEKIVPYLEKPEEVTIGKASWYASSCAACTAGCGVLVKSRDGRPIKLEGNTEHPLNLGGLCSKGQASILDLYDSERLKGPCANDKFLSWTEVDSKIQNDLKKIKEGNGQIRILSSTLNSPTALKAIEHFGKFYSTSKHVSYDPISSSAILDAHYLTHGQRVLPWYRFDKARTIVSFDADFLGTWISPVEFTKGWALNRQVDKKRTFMSWHAQIESRLSLTGANADHRIPLKPSQYFSAVLQLGEKIAKKLNWSKKQHLPSPTDKVIAEETLEDMANRLIEAKGRSLVISGMQNLQAQIAINFINHMLENYGSTLDVLQPSLQQLGNDTEMDRLIDEMNAGKVAALILYDVNPAYDHPKAEAFRTGLKRVGVTISLSPRRDETADLAQYLCPDHHSLESWLDGHPHYGIYNLYQPIMAPLYDTRSAFVSLLRWAGVEKTMHEAVQETWSQLLFPLQKQFREFQSFWVDSVRNGMTLINEVEIPVTSFNEQSLAKIKKPKKFVGQEKFELLLYPSIAIGSGKQANNPWLQELPDPISKATWGNYASISPKTAKAIDVVEGRLLEVSSGARTVRLPTYIQPGIPENMVAIALGYGRTKAVNVMANFPKEKMLPIDMELLSGADLYPFVGTETVSIKPLDEMSPLAKTQQFDYQKVPFTEQERPLVLATTLKELKEEHLKKDAKKKEPAEKKGHEEAKSKEGAQAHGKEGEQESHELWPEHKYPGHKWGMAIDLNSCTGCSGCIVACQAENNIPVVGKTEVRKSREMHWLRIDRYYSGSENEPDENPDVAFQPMMCQQCDNAPCETVCPVLATVHSSEGLNMQVYNRCVGTRYCANNCPYKVRRFNWFDYSHEDPVQNLVLNPDITVRSRGIMEKCTFCVQRITETKIEAKGEGRKPKDGEIQPACQQSCPANAIIFGDVNDPNSKISNALKDSRSYVVLGEVGTKPSVNYLKKVRNREE